MSKLDDFKKFKQKSVVQTPVKDTKEVKKIEFKPVPLAELNRVTSTSKMSAPIQLKKEQEIGQQVAPINTVSKPILSPVLPELKAKSEQKSALKDYANWKKAELNQITPEAQVELEANNFTPREQQIVMGIVKGSKEERDTVNLKIAKNKEASPYVAAAQNFFEGASMGLSNLALSKEEKQEVDRASSENKAIAIGSNIAGSLLPQGILYKAVNKALAGTKLAQASGGLKGFGSSQAVQLVADAIVQAPIETMNAIREDKTLDEATRDFIFNRGIDLATNLFFAGGEAAFKGAKNFFGDPRVKTQLEAKGTDVNALTKAIDEGDIQKAKDIIYVNQFGVAPKEPFEQLQLEAPRNINSDAIGIRLSEKIKTVQPDSNGIDLYHGTWRKHQGFEAGRDFYFTPDKEFAESFIRQPKEGTDLGGELLQGKLNKNAKILDARTDEGKKIADEIINNDYYMSYSGLDKYKESKFENGLPKFTADDFIAEAKAKGYDGIVLAESLGKEGTTSFRLFNPEAIEVKPQLDRPSEFSIGAKYPPLAKNFTTERPFTVTPSEVSKVEQFKQFKAQNPVEQASIRVEEPQVSMTVKQTAPKEPVDTLKMVMTDMPSVRKSTVGENIERLYQETVSKAAPFETLARKTDTPLLRASATNLNRTTGTIDYNISKAQSDMEGNQVGDSILNIFKQVDNNTKPEFYDYVLNKHNIQRFEQGKPVFGDTVDSALSAQKVVEYESKYPKFKEQQEKVTTYFNNLMNEWGVKSGLVSEETAKSLREMYPNYVPTYRSQEIAKAMGGDGNFVSNILKKAKGSEKDILPLDQQMAILTDRTIRNARKNEVMTILDDVYQANPEIASKYISNVKKVGEKKVVSDILDVGKEIEAPVVKEGDKYLVNFYRNGEPHQMTINKTLYEAIRTMEQDGLDKGLNVIRKYATNPFKGLITQYNPLFAVRNIMRDIPTALIYSNDSVGLVKNVPDAIKEMMTNGKLWNQFQSMGGTRSGLFNYEKGVKVAFDGQKKTVKDFLSNAGSKFEAINNFTETLPRFAEYVTSIKKGESPMLALMRSAEITTDFSRFGKQTKRADAVVPYLNASVQGLDKFFRQMRDKPLQTMAKGGLVVSIPALILDQVNKDNEDYNEMTSRERNNYYHIPKGDGTFYRIPRSREVGVLFGTAMEWATRKARGQEVTGDEIIETLKSNFTPVNGFDSNIIKPAINFVNIATGKNPDAKNFFGSNIVPESLQRYSPGEQFTENTTSLSKALGKYLDVPPVAIDYLLDSYLGVVADVGMPLLTENKSKALAPFESAFIADPVFKSGSVDKFYSSLDKLNKISADTNRNYDIDSKLVTPYEVERNKLNKLSKELSNLRKQQAEAQKKNDKEKVREIRIQMNELSKEAVSNLPSEEELQKLFEKFLKERQVK